MPTYSASSIIGVNLVAAGTVNVYDAPPGMGGNVIGTFSPGAQVGAVYSYITDTDGTIYWEFLDTGLVPMFPGDNGSYFTPNTAGLYDNVSVENQVATAAAAAATAAGTATSSLPSWLTSLWSDIEPYALDGALILIGIIIIKSVIEGAIEK